MEKDMMRNTLLALAAAATALVLAVATPGTAHAAQIYALDNGEHQVFIGETTKPGTGVRRAYACYHNVNTSLEVWVALGPVGGGLDDNYVIHGDQTSGAANDDVMRMSSFPPGSSFCTPRSGYSWRELDYNGYFLDMEGDDGNDDLIGGFGDTILRGEGGRDQLTVVSCSTTFARGQGGGGNDGVNGRAGTCDRIEGGDGADCLHDPSTVGSWSLYDCGNDAGDARYWLNTASLTVGCPGQHFNTICTN